MKPEIQLIDKAKDQQPLSREQIKKIVTDFLQPFDLGKLELGIHLISEQEIKRINRSYRNKDQSTDVISFPIDEPLKKKKEEKSQPRENRRRDNRRNRFVILGDIFLSPEVIKKEVGGDKKTDSNKLATEIIKSIKHGLTHLLGFSHRTDREKKDFNRIINQR
jgi:probable rRNA maturation factor